MAQGAWRSFAPGSTAGNHNLALWKWSERLPHQVRVHNPGKRLRKDGRSWRAGMRSIAPPTTVIPAQEGTQTCHPIFSQCWT